MEKMALLYENFTCNKKKGGYHHVPLQVAPISRGTQYEIVLAITKFDYGELGL